MSGDFFGALGIVPVRGRLLGPGDYRGGCDAARSSATVLAVVVRRPRVRDRGCAHRARSPVTVIGVAPASFTGLEVGETFDIALPLCATALWDGRMQQRDRWWLTMMGRLKPEWTVTRANEHCAVSPGVLDATIPPGYDPSLVDGYRRLRFGVVPAGRGVSRLRDAHAAPLTLLLGLTSLVLLMTCGNLATLMLARASAREREVAVRAAIGASRGRLVSQMLVESLLIAAAGAVLAVPVALLSARALMTLLGTSAGPIALQLAGNWRLMAFVSATATLTAVLFGLLPALRVSLVDPNTVMRHGARGTTVDRHARGSSAGSSSRRSRCRSGCLFGTALRADVPQPGSGANRLRARGHARDFVHGSCIGRAHSRTKSRVPGPADA